MPNVVMHSIRDKGAKLKATIILAKYPDSEDSIKEAKEIIKNLDSEREQVSSWIDLALATRDQEFEKHALSLMKKIGDPGFHLAQRIRLLECKRDLNSKDYILALLTNINNVKDETKKSELLVALAPHLNSVDLQKKAIAIILSMKSSYAYR